MDINQIGLLLAYQRGKRNISSEELGEGICDSSTMRRLENGGRGCEKIVAEALLQRAGFASDEMLYFLEAKEAKWLKIKEQLLVAIAERDDCKTEHLFKEYREITKGKSVLHKQFLVLLESLLKWDRYKEKSEQNQEDVEALEKEITDGWKLTRGNYALEGECPNVMSTMELLLKFFYAQLQEEKGRTQAALSEYKRLLIFVEENMESAEGVKYYPRLTYQILLLLEREKKSEEQEQLYQRCLDVMKKEGSMSYLLELSIYRRGFLLEKECTADEEEEIAELENLIEVLQWLYDTYNVKRKNWLIQQLLGKEEVFVLSETIRNRRICFGMTQEELAEGICDPVTMSRIENGVSACKKGRVGALMDKLHLPGGAAVFSVQTGRVDTYELVEEIKRLARFGRHEECVPLFDELKKKTLQDRCVEQFMLHKEATIKKNTKQIDEAEHWKNQKEALHKTVPLCEPGKLKNWVFTRTEAMIVNALSYGCKKTGNVLKTIDWLKILKEYYEQRPFGVHHYIRGYELTLCNLANILDQTQEYEAAIGCEDIAIRLALEADKANVLGLTTYGRGWNMERLWQEGDYTKEDSRPYVRAAVILNRIYANDATVAYMEKYWKRYYE